MPVLALSPDDAVKNKEPVVPMCMGRKATQFFNKLDRFQNHSVVVMYCKACGAVAGFSFLPVQR